MSAAENGRVYYYLAEALNLMGDLAGARARVLDRALEATPRDGKVYNLMGRVLDRLHRSDEATLMYHRSRELQASDHGRCGRSGLAPGGCRGAPGRGVARAAGPGRPRLDAAGGQRFADQRRVSSPLEAGAAVVTGGGDLAAPFVIHVIIRDSVPVAQKTVRRALVSAWQRAGAWGLGRIAARRWWARTPASSVWRNRRRLLVETFPGPARRTHPAELCIVVERQEERDAVEAIVRRTA